ncbi:BamA/TamA family outer membrane protein [Flammeovirga kamogawensis]|nr:BamA/TamA family outer membrane protein [Flammeovirga kamogawensis]
MIKYYLLLLFIAMFFSEHAIGQSDSTYCYRNNFIPTPTFTHTPENGSILGVAGLYQFKVDKADEILRASYAHLWLAFNLEGKFYGDMRYNIYTRNNKFYLEGAVSHDYIYDYFYGIGYNANNTLQNNINFKSTYLFQKVLYNVGNNNYLGLQGTYEKNDEFNVTGNPIEGPLLNGFTPYQLVGMGGLYVNDERNSRVTPTEKHYFESSIMSYSTKYGSDYNFMSVVVDYRRYIPLNTDYNILAIQVKTDFTIGDAPIQKLAMVGGKQIGRGYISGHYRDNHALQAQTEYRTDLFWRLGAVIFASGSVIANDVNDLSTYSKVLVAGGAGLRFNINKKDKSNIRLDLGMNNRGETGVYIGFGEAF